MVSLPMSPPRQVWHPWFKWEEVAHNMWGSASNREAMLQGAITLTGNHARYGLLMRRVVVEWPISCENALTDPHLCHRAWVGHAACALGLGCPEDITRQAWGYLSNEQKLLANKEADGAIAAWWNNRLEGRGVGGEMGGQVLPLWDTR